MFNFVERAFSFLQHIFKLYWVFYLVDSFILIIFPSSFNRGLSKTTDIKIIQKFRNKKSLNINKLWPQDTHTCVCLSGVYSMIMFKSFALRKFWTSPYVAEVHWPTTFFINKVFFFFKIIKRLKIPSFKFRNSPQ